uniref:Uncharacterized protein n=1 Tax=Lotharella oceanica TaxID=641309 RepID=A0A7S2U221_9EUKA
MTAMPRYVRDTRTLLWCVELNMCIRTLPAAAPMGFARFFLFHSDHESGIGTGNNGDRQLELAGVAQMRCALGAADDLRRYDAIAVRPGTPLLA